MTNDAGHHLMSLFNICTSSFLKCVYLSSFKVRLFVLLSCRKD